MAQANPDIKTTVETIQDELLRRICFLDYLPDTQLKEATLAAEFGVSRTPVRDALSRISHLGLVDTRNGVGTVVVALSPAEVRHVYDMRLELATLIGTLSPRPISEADRQAGRGMLDEAQALADTFHPRGYMQLNHRLHSLIAGLIGNPVLHSFWWQTYYQAASTWYRLARHSGPDMAHALVAELRDVTAALDHGDTAAIGLIQRTHIGYGYKRIAAQPLRAEA